MFCIILWVFRGDAEFICLCMWPLLFQFCYRLHVDVKRRKGGEGEKRRVKRRRPAGHYFYFYNFQGTLMNKSINNIN